MDELERVAVECFGLAGLAWCHSRNDVSGTFPDVNRQLIRTSDADLADRSDLPIRSPSARPDPPASGGSLLGGNDIHETAGDV
jgi:hypothetical protein